ncbi:Amidophosphoribosyltransferase [Helicobacter bizzozeronii]|nr:Amidophosphoribosyltransferase [Helicobacter bizzozeronii]
MRCLVCGKWVLGLICARCYADLCPSLVVRSLEGVPVYSFYVYEEIEWLIKSKYQPLGSRVLALLARRCAEQLAPHLPKTPLYGVGIDDHVKRGYSHTAVILHALCVALKPHLKAKYNQLKATNPITYAGQSLKFRQENKKNFVFSGDPSLPYFLVDDVLTTGSTMQQAIETLQNAGARVVFACTLAHG